MDFMEILTILKYKMKISKKNISGMEIDYNP